MVHTGASQKKIDEIRRWQCWLFLLLAWVLVPSSGARAQSTATLVPTSYSTTTGSTVGGSAASTLDIKDQSGSAWDTSKIVQFNTSSSYDGYQLFTLPSSITPSSITALQVKVNYSGACYATEIWTWYLYNWATSAYVAAGNNNGVACWGDWAILTFNVPGAPANYVRSSDKQMKVRITANNGVDGMAEDWEAIAVTYSTQQTVSVTISPTVASVQVSQTQQFTATVTGSTNHAVTWQVNNVTGGSSTVGTISTAGLYTAPSTVPNPANVTVKAISRADGSKSASAPVTVTAATSAAAPGVGVSGNKIIATTAGTLGVHPVNVGDTLDLRGVNLSGAEYSCLTGTFWDVPAGNQTTINHMRDDWHANSIRLPLNEECWLGINGAPAATSGANYQNVMGTFVNLATASGMVVEVDLHFGTGGSKLPKDDNFPAMDADHASAFWQSVANYFKGNASVIFNLTNEPHDTSQVSWSCYLNGGCTVTGPMGSWTVVGTQSVVDTIRATGAANAIIIAGLNWSNDLSQWLNFVPVDSAHAIVAGVHVYQDGLGCDTSGCWTSEYQAVENAGYPVMVSEFGQLNNGSCNHSKIDLLMAWADAANPPVGYWAWAFTVGSCGNGPSLISDANGTPSQTYGQGFHDHLVAVQ